MMINYLPIRSNTLFQRFPTSIKDGVVFCAGVTHEHEFRVPSELHILRMVYIAISIFLSVIRLLSFVYRLLLHVCIPFLQQFLR